MANMTQKVRVYESVRPKWISPFNSIPRAQGRRISKNIREEMEDTLKSN